MELTRCCCSVLARTIETVEGGGLVVMLLKTMDSLRQLYTMAMDVHARYRTEAQHEVVGRFNERFLLSLANCQNCLVVDDEVRLCCNQLTQCFCS